MKGISISNLNDGFTKNSNANKATSEKLDLLFRN